MALNNKENKNPKTIRFVVKKKQTPTSETFDNNWS